MQKKLLQDTLESAPLYQPDFYLKFQVIFYPHLFELQSKLVSWCRNICCQTCSKVPGRQQFFDLFSKRFLEQKIKLKIIINLLY